jgi:hypothetical protein
MLETIAVGGIVGLMIALVGVMWLDAIDRALEGWDFRDE